MKFKLMAINLIRYNYKAQIFFQQNFRSKKFYKYYKLLNYIITF